MDRSPEPSGRSHPREGAGPRYQVRVARFVHAEPLGLVYECDASELHVRFADVRFAYAAEVGEPEGISATVFDVVLDGARSDDPLPVVRLDADRGDDARELASALERGLGAERCSPSLREVAASGFTSHQFLDLEAFEQGSLASLPKD